MPARLSHFVKARKIGLLIFLSVCKWSPRFFLKNESDGASSDLPKFWPLWWSENRGLSVLSKNLFSIYFFIQNTHKNTVGTMINLSMALKNLKTSPKKPKSTQIQKSTRV
jgi:hypothetical protein